MNNWRKNSMDNYSYSSKWSPYKENENDNSIFLGKMKSHSQFHN